jgi:hypothetical protein
MKKNIPERIANILLSADGKALATHGKHGTNVVPVSSVTIVDGEVWLINYFMGKTVDHIEEGSTVALAFWKGFEGYQIRAEVAHHTEGPSFEKAKEWIAGILPDRTVRGLLILSPVDLYDVSAHHERAGTRIEHVE